jgi:hypothetical protein
MRNRVKTHEGHHFVPATVPGPKPGDFPAGSPQSRAAARAIVAAYADEERKGEEAKLANLTEFQRAFAEWGDSPGMRAQFIGIANMMEAKAAIYGTPLPSLEEIRHVNAVLREINRLADGKGSFLSASDPEEWNRLKAIAEENVRTQEMKSTG